MSTTKLNRSDVLNKLMEVRGNALAIAGLGSPVWDLAASDHQPENLIIGVVWAVLYQWD